MMTHLPEIAAALTAIAGGLWALNHIIRKTTFDANRDARLERAEQAVYRNYSELIEQLKTEALRQRDEIQRLGTNASAQAAKILHLERMVSEQSNRIVELTRLLSQVKYGRLDPMDVPTNVIYPNTRA